MDIAEGDYIPDIAMGDDPLSKVFFISYGLLQMIRDKYKLKFARYVAYVAASQPDSRPVPDWFVENLLRDYLNQKFLLDPPLPVKRQAWHGEKIEGVTLKESNWRKDNNKSLNVDEDYFYDYLDNNWKDWLITELTPLLECIRTYCIDPDINPDYESGQRETAYYNCGECGEEIDAIIMELETDIKKIGLIDYTRGISTTDIINKNVIHRCIT